MQGECIKVKGGRSKKVVSPKGIDIKNRFRFYTRYEAFHVRSTSGCNHQVWDFAEIFAIKEIF